MALKIPIPRTSDGFEIFSDMEDPDVPKDAKGKDLVKVYTVTDDNGEPLGFPESEYPEMKSRFFKTQEETKAYIIGFAQGIQLLFEKVCTPTQRDEFGHIGTFGIRGCVMEHEAAKTLIKMVESNEHHIMMEVDSSGLSKEESMKALKKMKAEAIKRHEQHKKATGEPTVFTDEDIAAAEKDLLDALKSEDEEEEE